MLNEIYVITHFFPIFKVQIVIEIRSKIFTGFIEAKKKIFIIKLEVHCIYFAAYILFLLPDPFIEVFNEVITRMNGVALIAFNVR